MTNNVISFSAFKNAKRAEVENAKREAAREASNKERIKNAALGGLSLASALDKSPEEAINAAVNMATAEAAKIEKEEQEARSKFSPAYCNPDNEFRGSKYDATKSLSLKEVAKRIRADIKNMLKVGTLPKGTKVSVRMDGYNALRVNITALPEDLKVYTPEYVKATKNFTQPADRYNGFYDEAYTSEYQKLVETLDSNTNSYNRDNSDSMTDYFDVRFYDGRAGLDWRFGSVVKEREAVDLEENA